MTRSIDDGSNPNAARDALAVAADWLSRDCEAVALATVMQTWGSAPVPVGGQMVIASEDRFVGAVSGGCVENDVIVAAGDVVASGRPQVLDFGVTNETAWRQGLPCGGNIRVLVQRLARHADMAAIENAVVQRALRAPVALVTDLRSGSIALCLDAPASGQPIAEIREYAADARAIVWSMPAPRVFIIGAAEIARHLTRLLQAVDYDVTVIDPRSAYATPERFPGAELRAEWPAEAFIPLALDAATAVVALAHVPDIDDEALVAALTAGCFYVGALGSTRNHARRKERLRARGIAEEQLARIRAPVGLDIGAVTPAEIAASILAEIILARRGPKNGSLA